LVFAPSPLSIQY